MTGTLGLGREEDNYLQNEATRRKRLGQYFTGGKLAHLLVALTKGNHISSAIDPMCGNGDMLSAVRESTPSANLVGIEIDNKAMDLCTSRFAEKKDAIPFLIQGNAFSWATISKLPSFNFDLVITNPPYVRYQSLSDASETSDGIPSGESVRKGLLEIAETIPGLEDRDREIFISIIRHYSGLSDLAVPSWILCSMLTSIDGNLAMVVPESWLSRDYAHPIHYLLLKFFRIRWVIEDEHRAWFGATQVKTTLLVAQRIHRAESIFTACEGQKYLHIALPSSASNEISVVGNLFSDSPDPDSAFAEELSRLNTNTDKLLRGLPITRRSLTSKFTDLLSVASKAKWFSECEPDPDPCRFNHINGEAKIPQTLLDLLPSSRSTAFITIDTLGGVGQGLRTGANDFFYCDLIFEDGENCLVAPGKSLQMPKFTFPKNALRPVLRKQSEAPRGYLLNPAELLGRVLILENFINPKENGDLTSDCIVMPSELIAYINNAEKINMGTEENPKFIPQLSAVKTNESKANNARGKARFWYMLPTLAKRHMPDLFVARVNNLHPKVMMNSLSPTIIDANFSTIWLLAEAVINVYSLLAFLNSSWSIASMELSATVMGGGALKLEATHLRRLPVPILTPQQWHQLAVLGEQLAYSSEPAKLLAEIDQMVAQAIFGKEQATQALEEIGRIRKERLKARKKR